MKGALHLRCYIASTHSCVILEEVGSSADLSLKWLSWKLVILMVLALVCRCLELQMIEVPGVLLLRSH